MNRAADCPATAIQRRLLSVRSRTRPRAAGDSSAASRGQVRHQPRAGSASNSATARSFMPGPFAIFAKRVRQSINPAMLRTPEAFAPYLIALACVAAGGIWHSAEQMSANAVGRVVTHGTPQVGGPFALIDQNGETKTDADFRGRWMLVYFG